MVIKSESPPPPNSYPVRYPLPVVSLFSPGVPSWPGNCTRTKLNGAKQCNAILEWNNSDRLSPEFRVCSRSEYWKFMRFEIIVRILGSRKGEWLQDIRIVRNLIRSDFMVVRNNWEHCSEYNMTWTRSYNTLTSTHVKSVSNLHNMK